MRKLVFFIGPAAAGKTTLAKALARKRGAAFFDMDTLLRPAAEAIMTLSGLDPNDRDSPVYKARCRDLGYRITMDAALENVSLGTDSLVVGPFTRETDDPEWIAHELATIGATAEDVDVKVVFVYLPEQEMYRQRLKQRGSELDAWKLDNWEAFSRSLATRPVRWNIPASSVLYFDNSGPELGRNLAVIEKFVYGTDA